MTDQHEYAQQGLFDVNETILTAPAAGDLAPGYYTSREENDLTETNLLRDVAFNRHSMNDGKHISPYDNGMIQVGADGIDVKLVQGIDTESLKRVLSMCTKATTGIDLSLPDDAVDWEEMLQGGLQASLETQTVVFAVKGVSRCCTHQLVRSRKAGFHQQSQRATYYGDRPEVRMPESIWRNPRARQAYMEAKLASDRAYRVACEEDISYQDARFGLMEGTTNFILCEYTLREFINVFAYRGCSMFMWEIVHVMREMRELLLADYPWLAPYIKISCEKSGKCHFQGWEEVEGQCDKPEAREDNRLFVSKHHQIKKDRGATFRPLAVVGQAANGAEAGGTVTVPLGSVEDAGREAGDPDTAGTTEPEG